MALVTGDETGLVKVWDISRASGASLRYTFGKQGRVHAVCAICWTSRSTDVVAVSFRDGNCTLFDVIRGVPLRTAHLGCHAALSHSMMSVDGSLVMLCDDGRLVTLDDSMKIVRDCKLKGAIHACHMHRTYKMVAVGGKDSDLNVYNLHDPDNPVFTAQNVHDHILDIEHPVYVTGVCIINPFVFACCTAYHEVRFYDRRVAGRPIQEYRIDREIERKPTCLMQWNANKFLIGEASGDVHLYDTRRGFASRAKLHGGVGSVRCMSKHPAGLQLLGVAGLDRKARIYHVPTGRLLQTVYLKQKATCLLFDKQPPLRDAVSSYAIKKNTRHETNALSTEVWDDMDPVVDELDENKENKHANPQRKRKREPE